jgi:phosphoesterase RecJ-like protein
LTYEIPPIRREQVTAVLAAFDRSRRVILTTHLNADGDGSGSEAALLALLEAMGKDVWIVNPTPFPRLFRFLVPDESRILDAQSGEAARRCKEADLLVVVDTGEKSRIGRLNPLVQHLPTVVVDHHQPGPDAIPGVSFRDPEAAAAGELVFDLAWARGGPWSQTLVDGIYVAILTDTGSFRFSNATPGAHRITAELVARGASPDGLHGRVFGHVPLRRVRLLERSLPSLGVSGDGSVAWMVVPGDLFRELGCHSEDLEGFVDYPRALDGVEVGLLFRQVEEGQVKVSFRSNERVDVNALAREFGGGGHVRAAGAMASGTVDEVRAKVVARAVAAARDGSRGGGEGVEP